MARPLELGFATSHTVADLVDYAQRAEALGFDTIWLGERYYARSLIATAAAIAAATRRIKLGVGIVSPFTRHPGVIAMEAATLDELSGGRLLMGLGVSQISAYRQGITDTRPATALREATAIIAGMLRGDTVVQKGELFSMTPPGSPLRFTPPRRAIPMHFGVMGPKSFELAGRVADGVLLGMFATPGFVAYCRQHIETGLKAAGRSWADFEFRSYVTFSVDRDGKRAKDVTRRNLVAYLSEQSSASAAKVGSPRLAHSGIPMDEFAAVKAEVKKFADVGDTARAEAAIPVSFIDRMIVAGTPDECREGLQRYLDAGVDIPVIYQVIGPDVRTSLPLAAEVARSVLAPR